MTYPPIVILSGMSGSGKSSALKVLEDAGFFCIDNFPGELFVRFLDLFSGSHSVSKLKKVALVMDARDGAFTRHAEKYLEALKERKIKFRLIFLACREDILSRRFSETRHRHPLSPQGSVKEGIQKEQKLLAPIRSSADKVIDTTNLSVHDLRSLLLKSIQSFSKPEPLSTNLVSFGYKHGLPLHSDIVMDVRFIPNPYFVKALQHHTGLNPKVRAFIMKQKETKPFISQFGRLLISLVQQYRKEGKSYLTVGIGCTGGVHRSVAIAEFLYKILKKKGVRTSVEHRDLHR
ncbi:MAG: RNase adapter RapZ [bacterium]|nr:RNase adapter RapZ [bacterium]